MPANERTQISSFGAVTSLVVAQNDYFPRTPGGLTLEFAANSSFLATIAADEGVGIVDITSFMTGASSVGAAGNKLYFKQGYFPWRVWVNVLSLAATTNVQVAARI